MYKKDLYRSITLNFMNLVLDVYSMLQNPYSSEWRYPKSYNFYVKKYRIYKEFNKLWIVWENLNDDVHYIRLLLPKYKIKLFNTIYFKLFRSVETTDKNRSHAVLMDVIYPDFCSELEITTDFSNVTNSKEAANLSMCYLYSNFFSSVSVEKFLDLFNLNRLLSTDSISYIKTNISSIMQGVS